jgi:superfamily II DNA or RNA helicase
MTEGIYEQLMTEALDMALRALDVRRYRAEVEAIDPGDSHVAMAEHLRRTANRLLASIEGDDRLARQSQACNAIISQLHSIVGGFNETDDRLAQGPRRLIAVTGTGKPAFERPETPLAMSCLLTGTRLDPSLVSQLRKEIRTADRIDILCSFIKWSGVRIIEEELKEFTARAGVRLRVITTSYMGATDLKAVDFLQALPNTALRISYDTHRTRLHAKAYLFHRDTQFGSAYIGSSNLSNPALTDGLEWNVKVSQYEQAHLWQKVTATFETYWNDAEFAPYTPAERERLRASLEEEQGGSGRRVVLPQFDLRPYGFQQEILDQLNAERSVLGRRRHLVVAATGTGKTMIAAFDYRQWSNSTRTAGRPRLLFVAHREEILKQSLLRFRAVLRDQNFGDLLVGNHDGENSDHLFVSIQSYNARSLTELAPDHFEYVVVDEFHHAAAPSYQRLLTHVQPKVLLGLTATPERADGLDILSFFEGHVSAEIRLPDAVNRKLLCPFHYFGISDSVDLSGLSWRRGGYRTEDLDGLYTGNDIRARLVIDKVHELLLDPHQARGLGFCVSVAHARFMAQRFREAGIPAEALSGESDDAARRTIQERLVKREINFIFSVDLYNEGVDIPEVDTVLFLRPTESLTIFVQQLGRGLRLSEGKECLTVLDFIGQAHQSYRFDVRYRALLSDPTRSVAREAEEGFEHLPAGCSIRLERLARQYVLDNIRRAIHAGTAGLENELRTFAENLGRAPSLGEFLDHFRLEPDDLYRRGISWSRLCARAGLQEDWQEPDEERLTKGLRRIEHIDSPAYIRATLAMVDPANAANTADPVAERFRLMAHYGLWTKTFEATPEASVERLRANPVLVEELRELLAWRLGRVDVVPPRVDLPFMCPLEIHSAYTRDEILAGLGHWTWDFAANRGMREGVVHMPAIKTDAFLFTLQKTDRDYSPTTMYQDYAISETLVHWQSQSTTSAQSPTGKRYIGHRLQGQTILLFAREFKEHRNLSAPYFFLGPADCQSHEGSRPISFVWQLRTPLPAKLYRRLARLAAG